MWPTLRIYLLSQITPRDLRNIPPTGDCCRDTFPCMNMALKLHQYFFWTADGKATWLLLPSSVSLLSGSTAQPENTYSCILKVTGQVWQGQKRIIAATTSIHLPKPVSTDLKIKLDWVLTNQIDGVRWGARWGAKLVDVKYLPHKGFFQDTITRRVMNQG